MNRYKIILASASPRRQELLAQIGLRFCVCPSRVEEKVSSSDPARIVQELSVQKAEDIFSRIAGGDPVRAAEGGFPQAVKEDSVRAAEGGCPKAVEGELGPAAEGGCPQAVKEAPGQAARGGCPEGPKGGAALVIGADTVVSCEKTVLGKPKDSADACRMLAMLQGRSHQVYTGVTVIWQGDAGEEKGRFTFYECTEVEFYPMEEEEIAAYVSGGEPMDKAGAYGIQGYGAAFIRGIRGDYNNVVGLPVGRLYQELRERKLL